MDYYKQDHHITVVSDGFSLFGFIFAWGWLFSKRLWQQGVITLFLYIPTYFFHSAAMTSIVETSTLPVFYWLMPSIILFLVHLYIGQKGNQWLKTSLIDRGYKKVSLSD